MTSQPAWTVLDTSFGSGAGLIRCHRDRIAAGRPGEILHYVGLGCLPIPEAASDVSIPTSKHDVLSSELREVLAKALPGFQRFLLAQGRISLTLCLGPVRHMLSEQAFLADEVHLACDLQTWDKWAIQLLARRCRRGTLLTVTSPTVSDAIEGAFAKALTLQGFIWQGPRSAIYNPAWALRSTRDPRIGLRAEIARCAIVGGGLSGAAVAQALAQRGWRVTVLDTHANSAVGGSGLPVGLLVPHVSVDDSPRSRLSRAGVGLMLQHAKRLLRRGKDWDHSGVMELTQDALRRLSASPFLLNAGWLQSGASRLEKEVWADGVNRDQSLWHTQAGWIRPSSLISAWLQTPGIDWLGNSFVHRMEHVNGAWTLYNQDAVQLVQAEHVVVANAMGAPRLLSNVLENLQSDASLMHQLASLQSLHGTVSFGSVATSSANLFPRFPVNGGGSLVCVGAGKKYQWFAGATYERDVAQLADRAQQNLANLHRLQRLLPAAAEHLTAGLNVETLDSWTGTRCVSNDRLPLVGAVHSHLDPSVWICTAMGSRGLSFAALCAELLAARIGGEPLPIEARLARSLDAHRPVRAKGT